MANMRGFHVLAGAFGTLMFNGQPIFECKDVKASIEVQRSDIPLEGGDIDSKMTGRKGSGSMTVQHVYTRGFNEMLEAYNRGEDVRSTMSIANNDPDAVRGQRERTNLANVWFNKFDIAGWTRGEAVEREYEFGFTPSDAQMAEIINV